MHPDVFLKMAASGRPDRHREIAVGGSQQHGLPATFPDQDTLFVVVPVAQCPVRGLHVVEGFGCGVEGFAAVEVVVGPGALIGARDGGCLGGRRRCLERGK